MPPSSFHNPVEKVSEEEIRRIFNEGRYFERVQSGELLATLKRNSHPDRPIKGEPRCARSQTLYYFTKDHELVAVVHQYMRPDGTLGLSGRPDPKAMYLSDRTIYVPSRMPKTTNN